MPTGSCLCGEVRIEFTGEPVYTALCHCLDDRKLPTPVFQIPKDAFKVIAGTPKIYTKVSDHGRGIDTHFCANCGVSLFRTGGAPQMANLVGVRAGVLDDPHAIDEAPKIEVFVERRPPWVKPIEGAVQLNCRYETVTDDTTS